MRHCMFALAFALLLSAALCPTYAQCLVSSDGNKPSWISNAGVHPRNKQNSDFLVISVRGQSLNEVRAYAEQEVYAAQMNIVSKWITASGGLGDMQVDNIQIRYRCVAEHIEIRSGRYNMWQLVQIAKKPNIEGLDEITRKELNSLGKNSTGIKPFVPGMAQIHRGDNAAGGLFIVGISALSVGAVAMEVLRADNDSKVYTTFNVVQRQQYIDNAATCQSARNILIAAAGAVYLWNIIDGHAGGKRGLSHASDSNFKISPYASSRSGGLILSINF